jgi:hypothetical protein
MTLHLGYAGPIVASFLFNGIWAALGTVCVYFYFNRGRYKPNSSLMRFTKPFHKHIKRIAEARIRSKDTNRE